MGQQVVAQTAIPPQPYLSISILAIYRSQTSGEQQAHSLTVANQCPTTLSLALAYASLNNGDRPRRPMSFVVSRTTVL